MSSIKAVKCKDGWQVTLVDTRIMGCESDVFKFIKECGLTVVVPATTQSQIIAQ